MRTRTLALLTAAVALPAGDAAAETTGAVQASPNRPNTATRLTLEASGGDSGQVIPRAVTALVARGFRFDRRAVARLCEPEQRESCPEASRIGDGTVDVRVTGPFPGAFGSGAYQGTAAVFLAPPERAGDLAGLLVRLTVAGQSITAAGRIVPVATGPYGLRAAFDPLPEPPPLPPGYTATLERLQLGVSARRTVTSTRTLTVRRRGRLVRRRIARKVRYDLIRTPPRCTGSWPVMVLVRYPGHEDVLDRPIACTP